MSSRGWRALVSKVCLTPVRVCWKSVNGAIVGPAATKDAGIPDPGAVIRLNPYVKQSPGLAGQSVAVTTAASRATPPRGGESNVKAARVMPEASASNSSRTLVRSVLNVVKTRTILAHPSAAETLPDRQSFPAAGWVRCAVVGLRGGLGHSPSRYPAHASEL